MKATLLLVGLVALSMVFAVDPGVVTQAQDDGHPTQACSAPYHVAGAGWDFCWQQDNPRAQGVELNQLYFHGDSVAWKIGVPFTLTQYENGNPGPFKDTLGTPGGGGHPGYGRGALALPDEACPRFFGGDDGVLLNGGRVCVERRGGQSEAVAVWSRFDIFNYRFLQGWVLDSRGVIEPVIAMGGLLIDGNSGAQGNNHYHHLYVRMDFDVAAQGNDAFQVFTRVAADTPPLGLPPALLDCLLGAGVDLVTKWCNVPLETKLDRHHETHTKWRFVDTMENNAVGRDRSYEVSAHSDGPPNGFSSFDAMVVQYKGDSAELGYEVPTNPYAGDAPLDPYLTPPEPIDDPVVWISQHVYHDTRDEDRGSMSPHYVRFEARPNNFFDTNPGEDTYPWQ